MWQWIGAFLMLWAIFDLFWGHTWLHRSISMKEEPGFFWPVWLAWVGIAVSLVWWG